MNTTNQIEIELITFDRLKNYAVGKIKSPLEMISVDVPLEGQSKSDAPLLDGQVVSQQKEAANNGNTQSAAPASGEPAHLAYASDEGQAPSSAIGKLLYRLKNIGKKKTKPLPTKASILTNEPEKTALAAPSTETEEKQSGVLAQSLLTTDQNTELPPQTEIQQPAVAPQERQFEQKTGVIASAKEIAEEPVSSGKQPEASVKQSRLTNFDIKPEMHESRHPITRLLEDRGQAIAITTVLLISLALFLMPVQTKTGKKMLVVALWEKIPGTDSKVPPDDNPPSDTTEQPPVDVPDQPVPPDLSAVTVKEIIEEKDIKEEKIESAIPEITLTREIFIKKIKDSSERLEIGKVYFLSTEDKDGKVIAFEDFAKAIGIKMMPEWESMFKSKLANYKVMLYMESESKYRIGLILLFNYEVEEELTNSFSKWEQTMVRDMENIFMDEDKQIVTESDVAFQDSTLNKKRRYVNFTDDSLSLDYLVVKDGVIIVTSKNFGTSLADVLTNKE